MDVPVLHGRVDPLEFTERHAAHQDRRTFLQPVHALLAAEVHHVRHQPVPLPRGPGEHARERRRERRAHREPRGEVVAVTRHASLAGGRRRGRG
ncbi:MAG: hypothetical protein ACKOV8_01630, partial [Phycisphaerales bacterium]